MKTKSVDMIAAYTILLLLGVSIFGMSVALVVTPALVSLASGLCIIGGAGVLGTAMFRLFRKSS